MRPIDADALKTVFEEKSSEAVCGVELCKAIISRIDEAPTVDAEPVRHGKWINCGTYDQGYQVTLECECCGESVNGYVQDYKYCPYCGAKLEAYEEEEYEEEE